MTPDEVAEARWDSGGDDGEDAVMERQALEAGPASPVVGGDERLPHALTAELERAQRYWRDVVNGRRPPDKSADYQITKAKVAIADHVLAAAAPSAPTPVSDERRHDQALAAIVDLRRLTEQMVIPNPRYSAKTLTVADLLAELFRAGEMTIRDHERVTRAAAPSPTGGERRWTCKRPGWMGACSPQSVHHPDSFGCGWDCPARPAPAAPAPLLLPDEPFATSGTIATDGDRGNTTYRCQVQQAGSGTCTWPTCGCGDA